jgi:predicted nucleic acid-binding protein
VIAIHTNILVYAHREDSTWHEAADRCLGSAAESGAPWAIPWPCIHEFLAIVTHPRIYDPPTPQDDALEQVACWLEASTLVLLAEATGYRPTLRERRRAAWPDRGFTKPGSPRSAGRTACASCGRPIATSGALPGSASGIRWSRPPDAGCRTDQGTANQDHVCRGPTPKFAGCGGSRGVALVAVITICHALASCHKRV